MNKQALLIFTRNPEAGHVKTRLAATIGNEAALQVYHQLLLRTVSATVDLPVDKFVFYSNYVERDDSWNNRHYHKERQQGIDLGQRMKNGFAFAFSKGYEKIVIIGTDCPELTGHIIRDAFRKLDVADVVIGPAFDGGYYLLGLKQIHAQLFDNMEWSTATVLTETINRCQQAGLQFLLLPTLHDVDEEKDLTALKTQG